jgi:L-amino acid N-acyltransferase YncA
MSAAAVGGAEGDDASGLTVLGLFLLVRDGAHGDQTHEGVAEGSVYVTGETRGRGIGRTLLEQLILEADRAGIWTVQASIFPENAASAELHRRCGFRVVGTRERIGQLNGVWRDTVLLERRGP